MVLGRAREDVVWEWSAANDMSAVRWPLVPRTSALKIHLVVASSVCSKCRLSMLYTKGGRSAAQMAQVTSLRRFAEPPGLQSHDSADRTESRRPAHRRHCQPASRRCRTPSGGSGGGFRAELAGRSGERGCTSQGSAARWQSAALRSCCVRANGREARREQRRQTRGNMEQRGGAGRGLRERARRDGMERWEE